MILYLHVSKRMIIKSKYSITYLLMILSMAVLTGFAGYWLVSQYNQEKKDLNEKLIHEYLSSQDQVIDSLVYVNVVSPAMEDSLSVSIRVIAEEDSLKPIQKSIISIHHDTTAGEHIIVDRSAREPEHNKAIIRAYSVDSTEIIGIHNRDMLNRSIRMIFHSSQETFGTEGLTNTALNDPELEILFREIFSSRLVEKGWDFGLCWIEDSLLPDSPISSAAILLDTDLMLDVGAVGVEKINPYLLQLILPQILFVIFLIGLTASAFLLTFRTMRRQLVLNRMRQDFISNVTHELKTPVATIKVALEALRVYDVKNEPEKAGEYMEIASKEVSRLDGLIAKVLDHIILDEDQAALKPESIDLRSLLDEILSVLKLRIEREKAEVELQCEDRSFYIYADLRYIQAVLLSLVDNSLKYGGENPELSILLYDDNVNTFIEVRDKGPGIPLQFREKIFDKFFRIPTGDIHNVKGHGLGLSLARQVMEMHKGTIHQENLKEGGCSFILQFKRISDEDQGIVH